MRKVHLLMTLNNSDLIQKSEYHKNLWKCRDFELQYLWQRSVFLTAFMLLTFTGYGALFIKIIDLATAIYAAELPASLVGNIETANFVSVGSNKDYLFLLNLMAQSTCVVGMLFSIMWIMMAKGSKAWYEVYEKAIRAFESDSKYTAFHEIGGFCYKELTNFENISIDSNIFSSKAGAYSPSKINISIGTITFWIWVFLLLFHILLSCNEFKLSGELFKQLTIYMPVFAGIFLFIFYLYAWCSGSLRSGVLDEYSDKK